jgi:glycosyltransferase involved in cell wall biosynthesis
LSGKSILYVTPALPIGGAEKFLVLLANSLVNDTKSQTVVSLSDNNKLQNEFNRAIRFLPLPRSGKFDIAPLKALRKLIREEKPDIIFCLNFFSFFYVKLAIGGARLKPSVIISYHSTIHENRKDHLLHKFYARIVSKNDLIITVSENQKKYTAGKYRVTAERFKTIHNGIDLVKWRLPDADWNKDEIRKRYGIPPNASVIIMIAAFRPEKNHIGAIKALRLLHSEYQNNAYLLFVGEGILFEQCRETVREQNLKDFIIFTGPQHEVRPFYWASDLFTLCSTSVETFSIAALEAMACGLPAVLTNIGGAGEMIISGLNGFLCNSDEADIARNWSIALKTDFSPEMIRDHISKNFGAEKMIKEYKQVLQLQTHE